MKEEINKTNTCDCKSLQYHPNYNVFHLGDPLSPFSGTCKEYYLGGKLKKTAELLNGKYEGKLLYYYENGQLQSDIAYELGLMSGDKKVFEPDGKLLFHGIYKRSKLIETIYHYKQVK
ncbi:toxin-antitoxin system YwqK family antitoxin [Putridiphycobacter roseus]|nr:hypothetical protein [Putridiphycobacter roseus]